MVKIQQKDRRASLGSLLTIINMCLMYMTSTDVSAEGLINLLATKFLTARISKANVNEKLREKIGMLAHCLFR